MFNKTLIRREDCVLIVIDVQERLMPVIYNKHIIITNIIRLIKVAKIINLPIIITNQINLGSTLIPIINELEPSINIIEKTTFDCLACTTFREELAKIGRNSLLITGIEAHICILQTALSAFKHYYVQVVGDAVSSRTKMNLDISLGRIRLNNITITSTEMFIFELLKKAETLEFKAILRLIK